MRKCEFVEKCPFFGDKMKNMPATAELMKKRYCFSDNSNCARYMVLKALGREKVLPDLFPNQLERAQQIIQEERKSGV